MLHYLCKFVIIKCFGKNMLWIWGHSSLYANQSSSKNFIRDQIHIHKVEKIKVEN